MSQQTRAPLTSFTLFSSLPAEIRIKIWHATFFPREIPYSCLWDGWVKAPRAPLALCISQESRREALTTYAPLLTKINGKSVILAMIAPKIDILRVPFTTFPGAPHFGRLATEYRAVLGGIAFVDTYTDTVKRFTEQMEWKLKYLEEKREVFDPHEWQDPFLAFGVLDVWTVTAFGSATGDGKLWEAPLSTAKLWFQQMERLLGKDAFRVPRILRVVDADGIVLASLSGLSSKGEKQPE